MRLFMRLCCGASSCCGKNPDREG